MQFADAKLSRSSLLLALRRYGTAVKNMEQTVLLPSLLRDVPYDDGSDCEGADNSMDLYEYYLLLKAIKNTAESGLIPHDDAKATSHAALHKGLEPLLEAEPEELFHFHLRGLYTVMATLTKKSQNLTEKYLDIIGISR
ncbi:mid1-interacting protein 1-B-like [Carassius auratus]|uniref:Mid1-interacting protein 1-B-like n=1 Tax=Carassius auratus TaxID=7957 RepID=A0A6P6PDW9_CARAU|nr:mid1-interacting protein 1-B-like [Carassius auratus]XP_052473288.1 mid1-interacting protein 1-B-like [Carassius gibelio]